MLFYLYRFLIFDTAVAIRFGCFFYVRRILIYADTAVAGIFTAHTVSGVYQFSGTAPIIAGCATFFAGYKSHNKPSYYYFLILAHNYSNVNAYIKISHIIIMYIFMPP
jgi:hypothetical protein